MKATTVVTAAAAIAILGYDISIALSPKPFPLTAIDLPLVEAFVPITRITKRSRQTGIPTRSFNTNTRLFITSADEIILLEQQVSDFYQNFPIESAVLTCGVKASVADTIAQVSPQLEENKQIKKEDEETAEVSVVQTKEEERRTMTTHDRSYISYININKVMTETTIDWEAKRNLAYILYGGIFIGLMSYIEYSQIFPFVFGTEKTVITTIEKVFFDNLLFAPLVWLPPAYFIKACLYYNNDDATKDGETSSNSNTNSNTKTNMITSIVHEGITKYSTDVRENDLLYKYWLIWFPAQSISFSVVPDHLRVAFMASISFFWFILFSSVQSNTTTTNPNTTSTNATSQKEAWNNPVELAILTVAN